MIDLDLIIVMAFAAVVLGRRRWLKRQPREFVGAFDQIEAGARA